MNPFNPNTHMMTLQGKPYLPVAPRISWINDDHTNANIPVLSEHGAISIETNLEHYGTFDYYDKSGKLAQDWQAVVCAVVVVRDTAGNVVKTATGHKRETMRGFADFVEKAETGAIGRALAAAGYGTLASLDFEEGEKASPLDGKVGPAVVDAPARVAAPAKSAPAPAAKKSGRPAAVAPAAVVAKVAVAPGADPLAVVSGNTTSASDLFESKNPPVDEAEAQRLEQLAWLRANMTVPPLAALMNEAIATHKVAAVSLLNAPQVQELYDATRALLPA